MMFPFPLPVMLAQLEGVFAMIFFAIAFIGWVSRLIAENQQKGNAGRQQPGRRPNQQNKGDKVRREIDEFLSQSRQGKRSSQPQRDQRTREQGRRRDDDFLPDHEVEVVEARRRPPPRKPTPAQKRKTRREIWEEQVGKRTGAAASTAPVSRESLIDQPKLGEARSPADAPAGWGPPTEAEVLRRALDSLSESFGRETVEALPQAVRNSLASELGKQLAKTSEGSPQAGTSGMVRPRPASAKSIAQMLRSPQGVRNAILLNEILSRPKSLQ